MWSVTLQSIRKINTLHGLIAWTLIWEWTHSPSGNNFLALSFQRDKIAFHLSKSFPKDSLVSITSVIIIGLCKFHTIRVNELCFPRMTNGLIKMLVKWALSLSLSFLFSFPFSLLPFLSLSPSALCLFPSLYFGFGLISEILVECMPCLFMTTYKLRVFLKSGLLSSNPSLQLEW